MSKDFDVTKVVGKMCKGIEECTRYTISETYPTWNGGVVVIIKHSHSDVFYTLRIEANGLMKFEDESVFDLEDLLDTMENS